MSEPVFKLKPKRYGGETTVVSMRLARELLADLDLVAEKTGYSRNEIMAKSLEFALRHMEIIINEGGEEA